MSDDLFDLAGEENYREQIKKEKKRNKGWFKKKEKEPDTVFDQVEVPEETNAGELYTISDIDGFFKYNINPSLIEAKVQSEKAKQMSQMGKIFTPQILVMVILIMFIGAIAYTIIDGTLSNSECEKTLRAIAQQRVQLASEPETPAGIVTATAPATGTQSKIVKAEGG